MNYKEDMKKKRQNQTGVTIVELMVTLAVMVLLLAVGIPMFSSITANNRAAAQANSLITAMNLARSEAVKRTTPVTIRSKSSSSMADTGTGTSANWANGWIVFTDANSDGAINNASDVIRIWGAPEGTPTITTTVAFIRFTEGGSRDTAGSATFTLKQANCTGQLGRIVTVNTVGQISVQKTSCP
ncbi:MAG: GspH/FimT family pseudopilin [Sedimenticola sp.]